MKFETSYPGDSSDGEEQEELESSYSKLEVDYVLSVNQKLEKLQNLKKDFKYEYLFKEIGGRLLHQSPVSKAYYKIKSSYQVSETECALYQVVTTAQQKIKEINKLINNKYIIGKYISGDFKLKIDQARVYFDSNRTNIKDLLNQNFENLIAEENFLVKLREIIYKHKGQYVFNKHLYEKLLQYKTYIIELAELFSITLNDENRFILETDLGDIIDADLLTRLVNCYIDKPDRTKIIENDVNQTNCFLAQVCQEIQNQTAEVKELLKYGISHLGIFAPSESDNAINFLAKVRAYHKFTRGIMKYFLLENVILPTSKISYPCEIDTGVDKDPSSPVLGKIQIAELHNIYKSCSRTVMVSGITGKLNTSYKGLLSNIKQLASKSDLGFWFKKILKGQISQEEDWNTFTPQEQHYFYDLTFLLFCCETTRNVSAFLTNSMFFDLLSQKYYRIDQLTTLLPIAMEKAAPSSVKSNYTFGPKYGETKGLLSSVLYYDLRLKVKDDDVKTLDQRSKKLFTDWFFFSKILNKASIDKFVKLTYQHSIHNLEEAIGPVAITGLQNKDQTIASIVDQTFCVTKNEYSANLTISAGETKLAPKIEIKQVPAKAFAELIHDWYGLEMPYLGEGVIILGSE